MVAQDASVTYTTPLTFIQRKRGIEYVDERLENGPFPLILTFKRVKSKVDKYTEKELAIGLLAQSYLKSVLVY